MMNQVVESENFAANFLNLVEQRRQGSFSCTDLESGSGFRIHVKHDRLFLAPFIAFDQQQLGGLTKQGQRLAMGSMGYVVEPSVRTAFLRSVKKARSSAEHAISTTLVTVQDATSVTCYLGNDGPELLKLVTKHLPDKLELHLDANVARSLDQGRKIGHAAKDWAILREVSFTPEMLQSLENAGDEQAFEAVQKEAVLPQLNWEELRREGVAPAVAGLMVHCRRIVPKRPERNVQCRRLYVETLQSLFASLRTCKTLEESQATIEGVVGSLGHMGNRVAGSRFLKLPRYLKYRFGEAIVKQLGLIEDEPDPEKAWVLIDQALCKAIPQQSRGEKLLPTREAKMLADLVRRGAPVSALSAGELTKRFGITGIEVGNWVGSTHGTLLLKLLAEASEDFKTIVGPWFAAFCRRGNLGIGIGSRGKGKSCAHYEPALRVINLTKKRGDGSLAHEYGHFLDHLIASYHPQGQSRYLSSRVRIGSSTDTRVATAMSQVMKSIYRCERHARIVSDQAPRRWFKRSWVLRAWEAAGHDAQSAYDRLVEDFYRHSRSDLRRRSCAECLVNSLAKWTAANHEIDITFVEETSYYQEAKRLGVYWKRPEELFARAFEAFVEDQLHDSGHMNDFLVSGTRRDYAECRGQPYPVGLEREAINQAINVLLVAISVE